MSNLRKAITQQPGPGRMYPRTLLKPMKKRFKKILPKFERIEKKPSKKRYYA